MSRDRTPQRPPSPPSPAAPPPPRCTCDWTFHKGRTCGNLLPVPSVRASEQLCLPCLFSCRAEREEARDTPPEPP